MKIYLMNNVEIGINLLHVTLLVGIELLIVNSKLRKFNLFASYCLLLLSCDYILKLH